MTESERDRIAREDGMAPGGVIYEMFWSSFLPIEGMDSPAMPLMAYPGRRYPIKGRGCRMEGCVLWLDHTGRHTSQPYYPKWLRDRLR